MPGVLSLRAHVDLRLRAAITLTVIDQGMARNDLNAFRGLLILLAGC